MKHRNVEVVIDYVKPERKPGKLLTGTEMVRVEHRLSSRLRHRRSKIIGTQEILQSQERMFRRQLVADADENWS